MAGSTRLSRFFPFALLMLLFALQLAAIPVRADDPKIGTSCADCYGPGTIEQDLNRHPPIQDPCVDGRICIAAHYPPLAPRDSITVTGYTPHGVSEQVMLTLTDPRTGHIVSSLYATTAPMTGDYAGYSAFRFLLAWHDYGAHNEYLVARVYTLDGTGKGLHLGPPSNQVQVWSPPALL
jgi:hypothetical protein